MTAQAWKSLISADFGLLNVLPGEAKSRFPSCTSIFIDDEVKVLIDPGAGYTCLNELKNSVSIDLVVNTHYHYDHISHNYLFPDARIMINEHEASCFRNRKTIGTVLGMEEVYGHTWVDGWLDRISDPNTVQSPFSPQNSHLWWLSTSRVDEEYRWGDVLHFGRTSMHVLGAPGHSGGFSCMYFPEYGAIYVADLDLTDFGPWYGGSDGDIDLFIASCRAIAEVDAEHFITGHERGILSKEEFRTGFSRYFAVIEQRDRSITSLLSRPMTLSEIAGHGVIYGKKYHGDAWVYMWETVMIKKHLLRLIARGELQEEQGRFFRTA